ncbi:hypothetical protein S40285_02900 [Stachybotrys chlorohalonatus IBT 40285]|uniref:DnaJ homologue subfamily C member 28 conserved domain-containing protein n=1 Tax=Stachybotrys chlorohalonatus (strain IBT 40285) TaxID=1283841 RepID=A0A084QK50_STAC4|nr:hypothetical protein S40285_02900 [Stachybotrys chlorohalonata IBT 40285]
MASLSRQPPFICRRCLQASRRFPPQRATFYSTQSQASSADAPSGAEEKPSPGKGNDAAAPEPGPMARRLEEATEEALLTGGRAGQRAVEEAGFSDELKEKLLDKIADAKFKKQFAHAFATAAMPESTGEGTRIIASSQAWAGQEQVEDTVLRMLDDAKKPLKPELRGKFELPPIDTRIKRQPVVNPGQRAATARDRASMYSGMGLKDKKGLSDDEREALRKEFRDRFQPAARAMPNTLSGLTALANERIEDAIARGQFKNIPRGKGVERDPRADNPFIDTTEYIMNKMIQRQDLVPPWIEKQQELSKAANVFRARLRSDWKRHVARMIAAGGGSLAEQMQRAEDYAEAERLHNPRPRSSDQIPVPTNATEDPVMVKMRQQADASTQADAHPARDADAPPLLVRPFRDAAWEQAERAYMQLSVDNLNAIARSYNLMAPDLAKKPYFSLEREMKACFADVAPLVAREIQERATAPRSTGLGGAAPQSGRGSILERFGTRDNVRVHLEAEEKAYGLKEWWRDFWKK